MAGDHIAMDCTSTIFIFRADFELTRFRRDTNQKRPSATRDEDSSIGVERRQILNLEHNLGIMLAQTCFMSSLIDLAPLTLDIDTQERFSNEMPRARENRHRRGCHDSRPRVDLLLPAR